MNRKEGQDLRRHRLMPVWKRELDREGFVRTLLLLAMHLDEKDRIAHKNQQNPAEGAAGQKGSGHEDYE